MRIEEDIKLDYSDVLIKPKRSTLSSRADIDLTRELTFKYSPHSFNGTPIMAANMDGVGTFSMALEMQQKKMFTTIRKHYGTHDWEGALEKGLDLNHVAISTGTNAIHNRDAKDYKTVKEAIKYFPKIKYICIDVANGYQENFVDFIKRVRDDFPHHVIMAGNVVTPEMTEQLIISGADIVKVGIGPGSVCTTRIKAGVGYPQLSAVMECADHAHGLGGHVIADGGCNDPGDVAKAFGAGADFVMLGGMLAGHEESEEEVVTKDGDDPYIKFYGMSSDEAMERHGTRKDGYRASEGKAVFIPYKGYVENTLVEIIGGVVSACTYVGARRLKDLPKCTTFIKVNQTHNRIFE